MTRFGMDVTLAHPEGYDLIPEVVGAGRQEGRGQSGGTFTQADSMDEAFHDADIVYPKSWAPFQVMQRRTELLRASDQEGLKAAGEGVPRQERQASRTGSAPSRR